MYESKTLIFINILCIVSVIFIERKKPSEIISWILVISFFPVVGFVLYLLIGETASMKMSSKFGKKMKFDRIVKKIHHQRMYEAETLIIGAEGEQLPVDDAEREKILPLLPFPAETQKPYYQGMAMMLEQLDDSILTQDNQISIFTNAAEKYDALYKDIEAATQSIHMLYFIFSADKVGNRFIDLLARKAKEGVEVRVIYDTIGSIRTRFSSFAPIIDAGGKVYRFFPLINVLKLNYRNHRKITVIDGLIAYTGGINIGKEYIGEHKRARPWRDTSIRVTGSGVHMFQERFLMDWMHVSPEIFLFDESSVQNKYFPRPVTTGTAGVQVVSSGPDLEGEFIKYGYIKMINSAKKYLYMQSPYFIPDDAFMLALKLAVDSGVDVRIVLPGVPDKPMVYRITTSYMDELLKIGVRVYLYDGFIHSKMFVMDGQIVSIGTANIDIRSFLLDFEINAFIYDEEIAQRCMDIFMDDVDNSVEINYEQHRKRSFFQKALEIVLKVVAPLV